jgi:flagellar protein FlaI
MFIKPEFKIVSVEDTAELNLPHENWIPSVVRVGSDEKGASSITLFDLLRAAVRQRPDFIIVGEVRGKEAYTLFQAMATGHLGLSTIHAESAEAVLQRLESEPMNIPKQMLTMIDYILVQSRVELGDKPARRVRTVTEVIGLNPKTKDIQTHEVYKWNAKTDSFSYSGRSFILERIMNRKGVEEEEVQRELNQRKIVLEWMARNNIRRYTEVANVIREYYADPARMFRKARLQTK